MLELIKIVADKYSTEWGSVGTIFNVTTGTTSVVTIYIDKGWVFYLTKILGNVTTSDINVRLRDRHDIIITEWNEFIDSFGEIDNCQVLRQYKDNFDFRVENASGSTTTATLFVNGFLIPKDKVDAFEKDVYDLIKTPELLRELISVIKNK